MAKLYTVDSFCISDEAKAIEVHTNKGIRIVNKNTFEKWVDDMDRRIVKGHEVDWEVFYRFHANKHLEDYLVIRGGSQIFEGVPEMIKKISK